MPRPEFTPEYLEQLEEQYQSFLDDPPEDTRIISGVHDTEAFKQVFMAGDWLGDRLHDSGAGDAEIKSYCEAFGQRCFGQPDPWEVAKASLRRFWEGKAEKPGAKLAEEICADVFGGEMKEMIDSRQQRRNELYAKYSKFVE
jgi:hypothetical protein